MCNHNQHLCYTCFYDHWYARIWDFLPPEQKTHHVKVCKDLRQQDENDPNFMLESLLVKRDQTAVFAVKEPTVSKTEEGVSHEKHNQEHAGGFL